MKYRNGTFLLSNFVGWQMSFVASMAIWPSGLRRQNQAESGFKQYLVRKGEGSNPSVVIRQKTWFFFLGLLRRNKKIPIDLSISHYL